jgi:hypothetical protein
MRNISALFSNYTYVLILSVKRLDPYEPPSYSASNSGPSCLHMALWLGESSEVKHIFCDDSTWKTEFNRSVLLDQFPC